MIPEEENSSKKKQKKKWPKIVFLIALILLLLLLLRACGGNRHNVLDGVTFGVIDMGAGDGSQTPGQSVDLQAMVDGIVAENQFMVFINTRIESDPDGRFAPLIQNSQANHHACWVEIVDGEETIYKSDVIRPGYKIEYDILKEPLARGKHDCQALFHVLKGDSKDSGEINVVGVNVVFVQK